MLCWESSILSFRFSFPKISNPYLILKTVPFTTNSSAYSINIPPEATYMPTNTDQIKNGARTTKEKPVQVIKPMLTI